MYTPFTSKHFSIYTDPVSQVPIAVLSTRGARIQQNFYYVSNCWSENGRYFWFKCAHPSVVGHTVAVIDFLTDEIHYFPETGSNGAVDPRTGNLYYITPMGLYYRTPNPKDYPVRIARLPEVCRKATVKIASTHLTFTTDYREVLADIQTPLGSFIGTFDLTTGAFHEWYRTDKLHYNHGQLNPVDNHLCMCAHDYQYVPEAGRSFAPALEDGIYPRMNLITRDGSRRFLKPYKNWAMHEWWAPDGKSVYYCTNSWINGDHFHTPDQSTDTLCAFIAQDHLDGSEPTVVCEVDIPNNGIGVWHGHCSRDQRYFVMDSTYPDGMLTSWRGCETMLHIYDRETGKLFKFLTKNPVVEWWTPEDPCPYHIDPHPRFDLNDTLISFTTTVMGRVDVAFAAVKDILPHVN